MTFVEKFVKKPVTTLLVFIVLVALGIYCTLSLPLDLYPEMDLPYMIVYTQYGNAGPEEVEQSLTRTLEGSLSGVTGLKKLQSRSMTGMSLIIMEFNYGTNLDAAANDIRDKIDLVRSYLPTDSKTPITIRMDPSMMPIMMLTVKGPRTPEEIRTLAEDTIQPRLEQIDGVASINVVGGRERSINVDIPRDRLEAYGLSVSSIAQVIGAQNVQSSGGSIESEEINYSIKTNGKYTNLEDLKNTVISYKTTTSDGSSAPKMVTLRLRDVADVYEGYKTQSTLAFLDAEPSVMLMVTKQSGKNSVAAAKKVRATVARLNNEIPSDLQIVETYNTTDIIEQTVHEVVKSVIIGAALAIIILFIFLRSFKTTFIIGLSIPISVFITLMLMYFKGISINMISMGGLLLGIGMLVDNSIVVLENIFAYRQTDAKPTVSAILGSQEMISSITSSTLTSVCIFLPMVLFQKQLGMMGQMFNNLAFTIIFSLLCSLFVAVALVPVLCSTYLPLDKMTEKDRKGISYGIDRAFDRFFLNLGNVYGRGVKWVLHHRKLFIFTILAILIGAFISIKWIGFVFMPEESENTISLDVTLPKGSTLDATSQVVADLQQKCWGVLKGVKYTSTTVGGSSFLSSSATTNEATVRFSFYDAKDRQKGWDNDKSAKQKVQAFFNEFPGTQIKFSQNMNSVGSGGTVIEIRCDDLNLLRQTATDVQKALETYGSDFITSVTSDLEDGLPQAEIVVDRDRMYELGLNVYSVGSEISAAINGVTASRYTKNGDDIDVVVKLAEKDRKKLKDLDSIFVMNSFGSRIPLSSFAHVEQTTSPVTIYRQNQTRIIKVTAKTVQGVSLDIIQKNINKIINDNIPKDDAVSITLSGDFADMMEAVVKFGAIIIMAAILVFVVMASQFESLVDPFIVLFTIPLSFIGVIAIYAITGTKLNVITIMGVLVLVGTIVNNGIVLVDYTNLLRKRGLELEEACIQAASNRLRPILMSTLTTVISLAPMAFFPGEGNTSMQPISLTVFGGMTFGSLMTLFLMPTIYFIINSKRMKKAEKKAAKKALKERKKLEARGFTDEDIEHMEGYSENIVARSAASKVVFDKEVSEKKVLIESEPVKTAGGKQSENAAAGKALLPSVSESSFDENDEKEEKGEKKKAKKKKDKKSSEKSKEGKKEKKHKKDKKHKKNKE